MIHYYSLLFIFLFGLVIGSFLNVIICRLRTKQDIVKKPSHCTKCKKKLKWYDMIPVLSFIILRKKCRYCEMRISWQYPIVELATGTFFALTVYFAFSNFHNTLFIIHYSFFNLFFIAVLVIIFTYDLKHMLIPDKVIFPAIIIAALYAIFNSLFIIHNTLFILKYLLSASIGSAFFYALYTFSRGRWIGFGDVKLAIFMGLMLGWPNIILALLLGFLIGGIIGIILILKHKKQLKSQVPFGPFLVIGTLITMFFGDLIINWYLGIIL
tara:strand:- start:158 stop:961 length:804 start_codon:yes stop_codon:yes gene_type:complete